MLSEGAERLFGLSPGAFSGSTKDLLGRVHPDDRRRAAEAFALEDGRIDVELRFVRGDGVDVWLDLRARTIRSLSDHLTRVVGVLVDVTQVREEARVDRAGACPAHRGSTACFRP